MASSLAHLELLVLCVLTLSLALLDGPVPRYWAFAAGGLLAAETAAVRLMGLAPFEVENPGRAPGLVGSVAEGIGVVAVPGLTAVLLAVVGFHCARAYARARRRLDAALAERPAPARRAVSRPGPSEGRSRRGLGRPPERGPA